jgi:hypothetical protein
VSPALKHVRRVTQGAAIQQRRRCDQARGCNRADDVDRVDRRGLPRAARLARVSHGGSTARRWRPSTRTSSRHSPRSARVPLSIVTAGC